MAVLRAAELFDRMSDAVDEVGPSLVSKVQGVIKFDITGADTWLVDLKNGKGHVKIATAADKADVTITLSEETLLQMMDKTLNPQQVEYDCEYGLNEKVQLLTTWRLCVMIRRS